MKHLLTNGIFPITAAAVVGAGYTLPTPVDVAPGQIITFLIQGIGAKLTTEVNAISVPLPTALAGISATFVQGIVIGSLPILSVKPISPCAYNTDPGCGSSYVAITVQIPFGFDVMNPTVRRGGPVPEGQVRFSENGAVVASVDVTPYSDQVHILRNCDQIFYANTFCTPVVAHADGSLVEFAKPAKSGEEIVIYAVGLGPLQSPVPAGQAPSAPVLTVVPFLVAFDTKPNALASRPPASGLTQPVFVGLVTNLVGLYQINVIVPTLPPGTPPCDAATNGVTSNLTINVVGDSSFDGARICVR